jgi:hypothetical protein
MSATLDKQTFINSYTLMVARSWADEDFKDRVLKSPQSVLDESGITTRSDAKIVVVEYPVLSQEAAESANGPNASIDQQFDLWVAGNKTGTYELRLPLRPDDLSLSDASLSGIAGGVAGTGTDAACCCCCPCCCCGSVALE